MAVTLSIIIPVYQCEKYISECLSSVLNQLPEDYELILVDDGSTDSTPAIPASYKNSCIFGFKCLYLNGKSEFCIVNNRNFDTASDFADEYIRLLSSC